MANRLRIWRPQRRRFRSKSAVAARSVLASSCAVMLFVGAGCGGGGNGGVAIEGLSGGDEAVTLGTTSRHDASLPTTSKCGTSLPHHHHTESGDERSAVPLGSKPTPEELAAADAFASAAETNASRYENIENARKDGYSIDEFSMLRLATPEGTQRDNLDAAVRGGVINHLFNQSLANDGVAADPAKPDGLMYATDGTKNVLAGVVFLAPVCTHGPQIGGPITVWHSHPATTCYEGTAPVAIAKGFVPGMGTADTNPTADACERGELLAESPEMLHVWFDAPTDDDRFSTSMSASFAVDALG